MLEPTGRHHAITQAGDPTSSQVSGQVSGPVIALVCSAGGLKPLIEILAHLPGDLPAALIVIQHQDPRSHNLLAHVLQPHTDLAVRPAEDEMLLHPGVVHLPSGGQHLLVSAGRRLLLLPAGPTPPPRPSADLLLTSLALAVGPQAIAVVLSGGGNDGATGATAIHRCGGLVITATEASSAQPDMPRATAERDHITAHVSDPTDIAALLIRAVTTARPG
ncbi:chemotaxis protein CheB [Kineococcus sp. SYSU DK003]|uniref:chemotaxis protein CheB n=1 Tax=Kineococcus sp. SYSU DK003 TaxID=3383124 RepID=UPI003D7D047B